ncbi:MAG: efflux RND transporter periplasmic adaptor subunit [Coriobacteriales bacterium]|nr:efflux RND transporter periplasmic adaptor subunit [Coriobacteriales bacterium]
MVQPEQTNQPLQTGNEDEDLEAQLAYETIKRNREARKRKRIIAVAIAIVVALGVAVFFIVNQASQTEEEEEYDPLDATSQVYRGDFATAISANGATEPLTTTVVSPEVEGIIENLAVEEGSTVNEGDVLFTIKNEELDKTVREAERQVQSEQRSVDAANRAVDEAYAAYNKAWNDCNESGDWEEFDEAGLREGISSAEDGYQSALESLDSAQTSLAEAQAAADKRTVRAPVSGTVVAMNAQNGASTAAASESSSSGSLMQISDLSQMKVTVQVNEVDIASIQVGQVAKATFSALPDIELDATVQRIASVSSGEGGDYGGVVTYAVDLLIANPDPKLKPGMTATVDITTQSAEDSLIVPVSALWGEEDDGVAYVTVIDSDTKKTRDVKVKVLEKNNSEAALSPDGELTEDDLVLMSGGGGAMETEGDELDDEGMFESFSVETDTFAG